VGGEIFTKSNRGELRHQWWGGVSRRSWGKCGQNYRPQVIGRGGRHWGFCAEQGDHFLPRDPGSKGGTLRYQNVKKECQMLKNGSRKMGWLVIAAPGTGRVFWEREREGSPTFKKLEWNTSASTDLSKQFGGEEVNKKKPRETCVPGRFARRQKATGLKTKKASGSRKRRLWDKGSAGWGGEDAPDIVEVQGKKKRCSKKERGGTKGGLGPGYQL